MQDAFAYCTELVRTADKDRFLATLFAPAEYRDALFALYAFDIETARIPALVSEALPGEIRLQWWRETIEGKREGEAAGHPVAFVLGATIARFGLPAAAFDEILAARGFDLYDEPIETLAALEIYMERTISDLIGLAAMILSGGSDPGPAALFRHAGLALGLAGLLRDLPVHAARRKLYLPLELLDRYKASAEDIFARKATTELRTVLADLRLRARRHLSEVQALLPQATAAIIPALLPLALVRPALKRMDRWRYDPFKPPEVSQWRRQLRLWRAAHFGLGSAL